MILCNSAEINFTVSAPVTILYNEFEDYDLRLLPYLTVANGLIDISFAGDTALLLTIKGLALNWLEHL